MSKTIGMVDIPTSQQMYERVEPISAEQSTKMARFIRSFVTMVDQTRPFRNKMAAVTFAMIWVAAQVDYEHPLEESLLALLPLQKRIFRALFPDADQFAVDQASELALILAEDAEFTVS